MAGLSPDEFWGLTPYETSLHILGFAKRLRCHLEIAMQNACVSANAFGSKARVSDLIREYEDPLE